MFKIFLEEIVKLENNGQKYSVFQQAQSQELRL
jgi:hypothetical protein